MSTEGHNRTVPSALALASSLPLRLNAARRAALGTCLMRPRRAARPPAAPAGSARSTIGAVAHRGEDPSHDGGLAAGSVQRVVIIRPPAGRSRFGGLAFDDPDDVEGSHVRHDPPSPRPAQGRDPLPPPRPQGPHVARPGASCRRWHKEDLSSLLVQSRQCGSRYQIGALRSAVPRGARSCRTCRRSSTRRWDSHGTAATPVPGAGLVSVWALPALYCGEGGPPRDVLSRR